MNQEYTIFKSKVVNMKNQETLPKDNSWLRTFGPVLIGNCLFFFYNTFFNLNGM